MTIYTLKSTKTYNHTSNTCGWSSPNCDNILAICVFAHITIIYTHISGLAPRFCIKK